MRWTSIPVYGDFSMLEALLALRSHQKEENAGSLAKQKCLGKAASHRFSSIPVVYFGLRFAIIDTSSYMATFPYLPSILDES